MCGRSNFYASTSGNLPEDVLGLCTAAQCSRRYCGRRKTELSQIEIAGFKGKILLNWYPPKSL